MWALVLGMGCGGKDPVDTSSGTPVPETLEAEVTINGAPTWDLVDPVLFRAEVGGDYSDYYVDDEYDKADVALKCLLRDVGHGFDIETAVITPGSNPHSANYASELSTGVTGCGFEITNDHPPFAMEFGTGVFMGFMAVANETATIGGSPDAEGVPILRDDQLPLVLTYTLSVTEELTYSGGFAYPDMNALGLLQQGLTHAPLVVFANLDFLPPGTPAVGEWTWTATATDNTGQGWSAVIPMHIAE